VFIAEGDDIGAFRSVEEAARALERVDVEGGAYRGFDAEGRRLSVRWVGGRAAIVPTEEAPTGATELVHLLSANLRSRAGTVSRARPELDELVGLVAERLLRQGRWSDG